MQFFVTWCLGGKKVFGLFNMIDEKIVSREVAIAKARQWKAAGEKIVFTNGCFDLLHAGHVRYLEKARALGDRLILGVNSDASVRGLKGEGRPVQPEADRAAILAALESVDLVIIFAEQRVDGILAAIQPHFFARGGDYTIDSVYPTERKVVESYGGEIAILPLLGPSTSELIRRIRS